MRLLQSTADPSDRLRATWPEDTLLSRHSQSFPHTTGQRHLSHSAGVSCLGHLPRCHSIPSRQLLFDTIGSCYSGKDRKRRLRPPAPSSTAPAPLRYKPVCDRARPGPFPAWWPGCPCNHHGCAPVLPAGDRLKYWGPTTPVGD